MKTYYKDQIKFEILLAKKEAPASTPILETVLLNIYEFSNLRASYPGLEVEIDGLTGKKVAILDGILVVELT